MEIQIEPAALIDSPFTVPNQKLFEFDKAQVEDFINDVTFGPPTSYLVSGYRGVGKTSLIRFVENSILIRNDQEKRDSVNNELVFVYTSFTKCENHVIRKLIRELYLKISLSKRYGELERGTKEEVEFTKEFQLLYQRTFKEVFESRDEINATETILSISADPIKLFKSVGRLVAPLLLLGVWHVIGFFKLNISQLISWSAPILLISWALFNLLSLKFSIEKRKQSLAKKSTRTLFDDEIASTLFLNTLRQLQELNFKTVFVLDELDKVSSGDIDSLIKELKPFLVGGYGSFIAVGGQELFYRYEVDTDGDDSILSSLFSKVFHVSLSSSLILKRIFYNSIVCHGQLKLLSDSERASLDILLDYFIFKSRLIPRRFIGLIRQNITWADNKAYLSDSRVPFIAKKCRAIIDAIDDIDDRKVSTDNYSAIRDYIITKMYIKSSVIFKASSSLLTKEKFLNG